jgi:hypothetical protein
MHGTNPSLSPFVRLFTIVVALVLIIGSSLFFVPDLIGQRWPWTLSPFNTRFLGAFYLAEMVGVVMLAAVNRWAPGRLALPLSLIFTAVASIATVMHFEQFDPQRRATWLWFILYIGSAIISAYFVWRYRRLPPANPRPVPRKWRSYLVAQGSLVGLYGIGLFAAPLTFSAFWPWPLDGFHAQVYSAIFVTNAAGALILSRAAAPVEWLTLGLAQAVFGLFAILGVVIVDATARRVDWALPATWLWLGIFAALFVAGLAMTWQAYAQRRMAALGARGSVNA